MIARLSSFYSVALVELDPAALAIKAAMRGECQGSISRNL
jgi:hypothetical protein